VLRLRPSCARARASLLAPPLANPLSPDASDPLPPAPPPSQLIEHELEGFGIRLNKKPPNITFKKKDKGGIAYTTNATDPKLDLEAVKAVLAEYK
jgi:hypothetical protein